MSCPGGLFSALMIDFFPLVSYCTVLESKVSDPLVAVTVKLYWNIMGLLAKLG